MEPSRETYSISDLAHPFDLTPRAIRLYENEGLFAPRPESAGGSRRDHV